MSAPMFLHIFTNGDVWITDDANHNLTDAGPTLLGVFRVNSDAATQKITTLSGTV